MGRIAVLDSGGQYCHLIARKIREMGFFAEILPIGTDPARLRGYSGLILSGGPCSVFDPQSPQPEPGLFELGRPVLGICYGHQLIASHLGGTVNRGTSNEFGSALLRIRRAAGLFKGLDADQQVWMSHGDHVARMPPGFGVLASTRECEVAAMGDRQRQLFGVQFHPEVVHTPNGSQMLQNFLVGACGSEPDWHPGDRIEGLLGGIRDQVGQRRVLLFLSGGVDSTVAYALLVRALGQDSVEAVYVDTGFMREGETAQIRSAFRSLGLGSLRVVRAADLFLGRLSGTADPEAKRAIIGQAFVDVQAGILADRKYCTQDWLLGQGTIYPDTIESGGTTAADVIKTHHNRVPRIQQMLAEGRVVEPLTEFYKDEVRAVGRALGLPSQLVDRHPFPGPGLAIRCLCSESSAVPVRDARIDAAAQRNGYSAVLLPLRSVGVQGDSRSYTGLTVVYGGRFDFGTLLPLSTAITNEHRQTNRVVALVAPNGADPSRWKIVPAGLDAPRVRLLQRADLIVRRYLRDEGLYGEVWQCPVVLLPWGRDGGETVGLRPVVSVDGMTASVAELPLPGLRELADRLTRIGGIDGVVYDVSHKPPSTIEWE